MYRRTSVAVATALTFALALAACGGNDTDQTTGGEPTTAPTDTPTSDGTEPEASGSLTVYSGRSEELVGSVFADFEAATGIDVEVRYASTAELAATILEEGDNSPADVFLAQDAGALGAIAKAGRFAELPSELLDRVDPRFRDPGGEWVGVTGRVRTIVYNTDTLSEDEVPGSVFDLTDPAWEGRIGWAPTNGSFQAFVTAMRVIHGDDTTREWIEAMIANGAREYPSNTPIVEAVGRGEVDLGLVNHYYLFRFLAEDPDFPAANHFPTEDVGGLVNVSGVGIVNTTDNVGAAEELVRYLLSEEAQSHFAAFADEIEYPLIPEVSPDERLPALSELNPPDVDLSDLDDLQGTLELLREAGALQ